MASGKKAAEQEFYNATAYGHSWKSMCRRLDRAKVHSSLRKIFDMEDILEDSADIIIHNYLADTCGHGDTMQSIADRLATINRECFEAVCKSYNFLEFDTPSEFGNVQPEREISLAQVCEDIAELKKLLVSQSKEIAELKMLLLEGK